MAVVIADAGPLIALAKLERLDLLPALFGEVLATQAVVDECSKGSGHDAVLNQEAFRTEGFRCIETPNFQHALSRSLGLGELSCIEFALQQSAESVLLIMDDALARKQALRFKTKHRRYGGIVIRGRGKRLDCRRRIVNRIA